MTGRSLSGGAKNWVKSQEAFLCQAKLVTRCKHRLNRLHQRHVWILNAAVLDFLCIGIELLYIDHRVTTGTMMVAVEPYPDKFGVGDFIGGELLAGHFSDV